MNIGKCFYVIESTFKREIGASWSLFEYQIIPLKSYAVPATVGRHAQRDSVRLQNHYSRYADGKVHTTGKPGDLPIFSNFVKLSG